MQKSEIYQQVTAFLMDKNIKKAAVFGSFARNEETENSDIDILIEAENLTLFDILNIEDKLQNIINRKIDLVEFKAVKPSLQKYIYSDLVKLI